jgi:D-glycero-alpha-D-manno-heptose-7-phosphate kinase
LSKSVSNKLFDSIYANAIESGADGGKISGAGGGGFFIFYCKNNHTNVRNAMNRMGLNELLYDVDFEGTKMIANFLSNNI